MKKKHLLIPLLMMFSVSGCVMYNGLQKEEAEHEHTYAETYSFNETDHWFAATCEHTDITKGKENHSFGEYVTTQEPTLYAEGLKVRTCSICGYKDEVKLDKLIDGGGSGEQGGGGSQIDPPETWNITALNVDRENIELTVGDAPITIVPRLVGEGNFPASITIECKDGSRIETVDGEEVTKTYKVADVNRNVVESGSGFTVSAVSAGTTQIVLTSSGKPTVTKTIEVNIHAKPEVHELTISDENLTVNKGSYTVLSCNSTDDVTWNSSDDSIICLENKTNSGVWLKAIKSSGEGTVTITATICAGTSNEIVKTCIVTVVSNEQTVFDYYYVNNQKLTDLHVYLWGANGSNAVWPGVALGEADYINKDLNEVYKITIDKDVNDFDKMIISGKDSIGDLQTDDIVLASFVTQNAFTIPSIPNDVVDGVRKASIRMGNFNPKEDTLSGSYITLSMNDAKLIVGDEIYVYCYTNANEVDYTVTSGDDKIQLVNETYNGFTIRALAAGEADIEAKVVSGESSETTHLHITVIDDEIVTYYFANNYQWKNLKVYMWGKHENAEYPGKLFAHAPFKNKDDVNTYEVSFSKYNDGYTGIIISGTDENKGSCKTQDIYFADLDAAGKNMIYITETEWTNSTPLGDGAFQYTCSIGMGVFESAAPKIEVSQSNITMVVGQTVEVTIDANVEYDVIAEESMTCSITVSNNKITITANHVGTFSISVQAKEGGLGAGIDVNVVEDETVSYYFVNNYKWRDLKVFFWNNTTQKTNGEFPGVSIGERSFVDRNGNDVYAVSFMKYADNYEGFIISGIDENKGSCKTQDIMIAGFDDNNGVELNGWKDGENTTALTKYGFYVFELYINIASEISFNEGDEININVKTNGENISYSIISGSDVIELKNEADDGVTLVGKKAGNATFTAYVQEGTQTITKTVNVTVLPYEANNVTYYFANNYCWSDLKVFLWNDSEQSNAAFPGVSLNPTSIKNSYGNDTYAITFDKNKYDWKYCIVSGIDGYHGWCKTDDVTFAELDADNKNMILINESAWDRIDTPDGYDCYRCSYQMDVFANFVPDVSLSDSTKSISINEIIELTVTANTDYDFVCSDPETIQVTKNNNKLSVKGLQPGTATIDVYVDKDGAQEKKVSCVIVVDENVIPDVVYTITGIPNGYDNDGAVFYIWIFGGDVQGDGQWISTPAMFSNGTITFSTNVNFEFAVLVRMNPANANLPSWDAKWNQSSDLQFDSNHSTVFSGIF